MSNDYWNKLMVYIWIRCKFICGTHFITNFKPISSQSYRNIIVKWSGRNCNRNYMPMIALLKNAIFIILYGFNSETTCNGFLYIVRCFWINCSCEREHDSDQLNRIFSLTILNVNPAIISICKSSGKSSFS